ncbi:MAG: N-formylglutamate amidohydrolase [Paracoccaceae bacterium]
MSSAQAPFSSSVRVLDADAPGPVLLVCEHASSTIPEEYGTLGLSDEQRQSHIAWDPGAEALTRELARRLRSTAVMATVSRLVYDLNRAPDAPNAITTKSEMHVVPGNSGLSPAARAARVEAVYLPFHAEMARQIALRLARGQPTAVVTVHSFTPVWFGTPRAVEIGVLHDSDAQLAERLLPLVRASRRYNAEMNAPYSAADHVTHMLRRHALPYGLPNVMLEVRNDLLGDAVAVAGIADLLAPAISTAVTQVLKGPELAEGRNA